MEHSLEKLKELLHHSKCALLENFIELEELKKRVKTKERIIKNERKHVEHMEKIVKEKAD